LVGSFDVGNIAQAGGTIKKDVKGKPPIRQAAWVQGFQESRVPGTLE